MGMRLFGLVGHPVGHSMSPVMHNASFKHLGLPYRFSLFDVGEDELSAFISAARTEMQGLNVTIPHKVSVMACLDSVSREAELIGAVNTIQFKDGKALGFNTDGVGCVRSLRERGVEVSGSSVLVLGAGGAARAIGFQMALEGADVRIANRSRDKAEKLAEEIASKTKRGCRALTIEEKTLARELAGIDVVVQATSVGMHPNTEDVLIPPRILRRGLVVMDIVYNPVKTRLLREAEKAGCKTIDGVGMLVHQGAASERIWLGVEAPVEVMRKAVYEKLCGGIDRGP